MPDPHPDVDDLDLTGDLRHLGFVIDSGLGAAGLGRPEPFHPLGLGAAFMDGRELGLDHDARPSLDEVLALRVERVALVQQVLDEATEDGLAVPASGSPHGWPPPQEDRTLLDTADTYGGDFGGSEELIGEALKGQRDEFVLAACARPRGACAASRPTTSTSTSLHWPCTGPATSPRSRRPGRH